MTTKAKRSLKIGPSALDRVRAACCLLPVAFCLAASAAEKPKVRAVTAFVRIDRDGYRAQVGEALATLRHAKAEFEKAGYQVESLRVTTQPFPEYARGLSRGAALSFFHEYAQLSAREHFDADVGPAMLRDGDDPAPAELLAEVLSTTTQLEASLVVAGEDGVHANAVRAAAKLIKHVAAHSPRSQGNFSFAATALVPPGTPFYPGSHHEGAGREFAVALESANVVAEVFRKVHEPAAAREKLVVALGRHASVIEAAARGIQKRSGWKYLGIDLCPAPLKEVSIGGAIEKFTGAHFGSSGTLTAVATITAALRQIPVKRVGYSGLMLPILEDTVLARGWSEGGLTLDQVLAYSAVCGTGLDTIPLPGDTSEERLERIITDMATLAVTLHKPLSARLMPVEGKRAGDRTEFEDPFLVNATIQELP